jgi:sugar lactone lactonase YvrE
LTSDPTLRVEVAFRTEAELGEAPVWDTIRDRLIWVDILKGHVHQTHIPSGRDDVLDVGRPVGFALPRAAGGLALGTNVGIQLANEGGVIVSSIRVEADDERTSEHG